MTTLNAESVKADQKIQLIDARGPRFGALITTAVLAIALLTNSTLVIGIQLAVFALAVILGPPRGPYGLVYKKLVKPRLSGDVPTEDSRPPRFAQAVGLAFAATAFIAGLASAWTVFAVAVALCLAASFLNAAFNFCLGCEIYLLISRLTHKAR